MVRKQSDGLRKRRLGTVINEISKYQDNSISELIRSIVKKLNNVYERDGLSFIVTTQITIDEIHEYLKNVHGIDINRYDKTHGASSMRPDGGIVWMIKGDKKYPILITERKHQGTNDARKIEGLKKQARGNAIERLGKNLDGFEVLYQFEKIFPVIVFGDGCDFAEDSSILGRVSIMNHTFPLNEINIEKEFFTSSTTGEVSTLRKCVMMFRETEWEKSEMNDIILKIIDESKKYFLKD